MALANDSIVISPDGSGTNIATHLVGGKEHEVIMMAGPSGHIYGSLDTYLLMVPQQAVGASKLHFDLWNGSASNVIKVRGIWVSGDVSVANTAAVSARMDWFRTSAVGTGGTGATYNSASTTVAAIVPKDTGNASLPAGVSARAAPTGGATSDAFWFMTYHQTEELQAGTGLQFNFNILPAPERGEQEIVLRPSQGLKGVQGTVAAAGTLGFLVSFTVE